MRQALAIFLFAALVSASVFGEALNISGAGPSTVIVQLLADAFSAANPEYTIEVPPKSIKHAGGMKWATSGNTFGRTGRPMSAQDKADFPTLEELFIAEVPVGFAVSRSLGVERLTLSQWEGILQGQITNWKEVGGPDLPISLLGRQPSESVFGAIRQSYPWFESVSFLRIYNTEDQILRAISSIRGAIGFSSVSVLEADPDLQVLRIRGFSASLKFGVVYDRANENDPTVQKMKAFLNSRAWRSVLAENGYSMPRSQ